MREKKRMRMSTSRSKMLYEKLVFCLGEAEQRGYSGDRPRNMVRLRVYLDKRVMPSIDVFRRWLDEHGLGRYIENLTFVDSDVSARTGDIYDVAIYDFIFPRHRLEDVRYLGHMIVFLFMKEHPEEMDDFFGGVESFTNIQFFTYSPKHGEKSRRWLVHPLKRFWQSHHKTDDPSPRARRRRTS